MPSGVYVRTKPVSGETRKKLSENAKGEKNHFFGKHHSEETKRKLSIVGIGRKSWCKGKKLPPLSKEHKKKLSIAGKGRIVSEETREKIKKKNKGKHSSPKTEFKKGHYHSEKIRKKISEGNKGLRPQRMGENSSYWKGGLPKCIDCGKEITRGYKRCRNCNKGENHRLWKGGITPENQRIRHTIEFRLWREGVFTRDKWTCQKTKVKGGRLHCHHIKNFAQFPELRFAIDNGITLSKNSHKKFHKIYGVRNNTKEQLKEFLC